MIFCLLSPSNRAMWGLRMGSESSASSSDWYAESWRIEGSEKYSAKGFLGPVRTRRRGRKSMMSLSRSSTTSCKNELSSICLAGSTTGLCRVNPSNDHIKILHNLSNAPSVVTISLILADVLVNKTRCEREETSAVDGGTSRAAKRRDEGREISRPFLRPLKPQTLFATSRRKPGSQLDHGQKGAADAYLSCRINWKLCGWWRDLGRRCRMQSPS